MTKSAADAVATLKKNIDKAITIVGVSEGTVTDFDEVTAFVTDSDELLNSLNSTGKQNTVSNMSKQKYASFDEYDETLIAQLAFNGFYNNTNKSGDNLAKYLTDYNKYLNLDLSEFNSLSKTDRAKAAKALSEMTAEDTKQMQSNLKKAIADNGTVISGGNSGGSGGGGGKGSGSGSGSGTGSGSGSGGIYSASASNSVTDKNLLEQKFIYPDMKDAAWAADAVLYLSNNGIISGYEDNTFRPNNAITRAEFTKIAVRAFLGDKEFDFENNFSNVSADDWFADVVNAAYKEGLVSGDGNGSFKPNDLISRQDMAIIIYNAAKKFNLFDTEKTGADFSDDASISDYAKDAVYTLKSKGIIKGMEDGTFRPLKNADRASAAQMIYSLIAKYNG